MYIIESLQIINIVNSTKFAYVAFFLLDLISIDYIHSIL